jgi:hypothetical protein
VTSDKQAFGLTIPRTAPRLMWDGTPLVDLCHGGAHCWQSHQLQGGVL